MSIFIPQKINVGFQKRSSTYTGKLAYVTYWDDRGKLRKEHSWERWRSDKIDPEEYVNEPTEGFVLNKKAGGYASHWNTRQTYCRVYDPRGFEFEITIENLLFVLENTNSIVGKGLEGKFVYAWSGKDIVLLPTTAPDYKNLQEHANKLHDFVQLKGKDLVAGYTYVTDKQERWTYLGKGKRYQATFYENYRQYVGYEYPGNYYWFYSNDATYPGVKFLKSLTRKIIECVDTDTPHNYAEMVEKLESDLRFSPIDHELTEYIPVTQDALDSLEPGFEHRITVVRQPSRPHNNDSIMSLWKLPETDRGFKPGYLRTSMYGYRYSGRSIAESDVVGRYFTRIEYQLNGNKILNRSSV